jgi:hypothetical protein
MNPYLPERQRIEIADSVITALQAENENLKCCGNCGNLECCEGVNSCCLNKEEYSPDGHCSDWQSDNLTREERGEMTDREKLCREFTELIGGHWHEEPDYIIRRHGCRICLSFEPNPTYTNPADVLKVILDRNDAMDFVEKYFSCDEVLLKSYTPQDRIYYFIDLLRYFTEPDKLLQSAIEWMKEKRK